MIVFMSSHLHNNINWEKLNNVRARENEIEKTFSGEIFKLADGISPSYRRKLATREISLGFVIAGSSMEETVEDEAVQNIKLSYLKNLKQAGFIEDVRPKTTYGDDIGNGDVIFHSIDIDFYPNMLLACFKKDSPHGTFLNKKLIAEQSTFSEYGVGFLLLNGKKLKIGSDKNVNFKLLETLCPFGVEKAVGTIFRATTTNRSKHRNSNLSLPEKQKVLRTRIKELQDILKKERTKVTLVFNDKAGTVYLIEKGLEEN